MRDKFREEKTLREPAAWKKPGHMNVKLIHEHILVVAKGAGEWLGLMDKALDDPGHSGAEVDRVRATRCRVRRSLCTMAR